MSYKTKILIKNKSTIIVAKYVHSYKLLNETKILLLDKIIFSVKKIEIAKGIIGDETLSRKTC